MRSHAQRLENCLPAPAYGQDQQRDNARWDCPVQLIPGATEEAYMPSTMSQKILARAARRNTVAVGDIVTARTDIAMSNTSRAGGGDTARAQGGARRALLRHAGDQVRLRESNESAAAGQRGRCRELR